MISMAFFESTGERVILDASWFLLLCVIFALVRFHKWRKEPESSSGREEVGASNSRKKAA